MFFSRKPTESKRWRLIAVGVIVLLALGFKAYYLYWPKTIINVAGQELEVYLARNYNHRYQGLSDREGLAGKDGMLFVFPYRGEHVMVMRKMKFPIDIVWVDNGQIVDIAPGVAPEPGRAEADLTPYFSRAPSNWVLELKAGLSNELGFKIGDKVELAK